MWEKHTVYGVDKSKWYHSSKVVPYRNELISTRAHRLSCPSLPTSTTMSAAETDGSADNAPPDFVLDPSDPLYMLLNNTHDSKLDPSLGLSFPMDLEFNDPSFSVFVDPNALFMDGKEPALPMPVVPLQPQDLLNPSFHFAFSSPTLSSASSPSGFSPSSPGSSSSTRASPPAPAVQTSTAGQSDSVE